MNKKNFWLAVLCGAVLTTLVSNLPFVGFINCLMFAGFWGSALLSVLLFRRLNGSVTLKEGVLIGLLTGICAGILGFGLSFFNLAGLQGFVAGIQRLIPADAAKGEPVQLSEALVFNTVGVLFNIIFGTIGGFLGGIFFRTDRPTRKAEAQA